MKWNKVRIPNLNTIKGCVNVSTTFLKSLLYYIYGCGNMDINKVKQYKKEYYQKNREDIINKVKQYRLNNLNKIKNTKNKYYLKNKLLIKKKIVENRLQINKTHSKYLKNRKENDEVFRFVVNMRSRLNKSLKYNHISYKNEKYLNCSSFEFRLHLLQQFTKKMNWENYGDYWCLDHIIPINNFNLNIEKNKYIAFNYLNTRPITFTKHKLRPLNGSDISLKRKDLILKKIKLNLGGMLCRK
jgi:hypothetical protein